jgi:high affinity Mn2+ porin
MTPFALGRHAAACIAVVTLFFPAAACAQEAPPADPGGPDATPPEIWALHGQATFVDQYHPGFAAAFSGPNSLNPGSRGNETFDTTLYAGVRPWQGAEIWISPEIDQGFGFDDTLGIAAFTSAEAYKVGAVDPYVRIPRLFFRQTIDLGGASEKIDSDLFTLGGQQTANRLVVTIGKFSVPDIFDANAYAHDPRQDFLSWALVDMGTFDYAADSWGYTYGVAGEWYQNWWTLRAGAFTLSRIPNSEALDTGFDQVQFVGEAEERHKLWGQDGKLKLLAFLSRGRMGDYNDATALAEQTNEPANVALVRTYRSRSGIGLNLEQAITDQVGLFARAGVNEGGVETYEFTDINKTFSVGLSIQGKAWGRPDDTIGLATAIDDISRRAKDYLAAGGLGVLVGDGALPISGPEQIAEAYYKYAIRSYFHVTADYQFVNNPAYNPRRGPVSVLAVRLHFQY